MNVLEKLKEALPSGKDESVLHKTIPDRLWGKTPYEFAQMGPEYLHVAIIVVKGL